MTAPMSPNDVVLHLADLARQLDTAVRELSRLDESAVRARARHEVDFARAFLSGDGSVDARKHSAVITVADRRLDAELSDQRVRSQKELVRTIQTRIDVGRTFASTLRSEMALAGSVASP